jgi:PAS domain-containing protein
MTVERDHKPGGTGRQRQHPPPADTTIMPGESPTLAGHSDREKPLFEQDRHIREWVGTSTALTERLEDELRASEQRFRITFEQAAVGLAHVALDGRCLLVNRKLCDIIGYTRVGSGLGLYISKRFVEAMQGRIWVESTGIAGQGSRFCLTLPCPPFLL